MYYVTTREMWKDLEDRYGQSSVAQVYSLHTELFDVVQEIDMTISEYSLKLRLCGINWMLLIQYLFVPAKTVFAISQRRFSYLSKTRGLYVS